jgi:site-specific DNA-cytosine methylase
MSTSKTGRFKGCLLMASDCAGMDMASLAVEAIPGLKEQAKLAFVSEVDPLARAVLLKNHTFPVLFGDNLKRDFTDIPRVSIYTAGFPCKPFFQQLATTPASPTPMGLWLTVS